MEALRWFWFAIFCFFALTLLFTWSKILVITRKAKRVNALLLKIEGSENGVDSAEAEGGDGSETA